MSFRYDIKIMWFQQEKNKPNYVKSIYFCLDANAINSCSVKRKPSQYTTFKQTKKKICPTDRKHMSTFDAFRMKTNELHVFLAPAPRYACEKERQQ